MSKPKIATCWLDGCSGCHMSFLDMDEFLVEFAQKVEVVWGPTVDPKEYPKDVDVCIIEGAVSSDEDLHKLEMIRSRTKILVSLGDCAITGNVPSMRNPLEVSVLMERAYVENAAVNKRYPSTGVPKHLKMARPLHEHVKIDAWIPGCPPPSKAIHFAVTELLAGRIPDSTEFTRFGK